MRVSSSSYRQRESPQKTETTTVIAPSPVHRRHATRTAMRWTCVTLLLLALVQGGHAAAGDIGSNCDTGDVCTPTGSYCDTTVSSNKLCKCNTGWFQSGITCIQGAGRPCHDSECYTGLNCVSGQCACDTTTAGYGAGSSGDQTCSCPTNYQLQSGVCKKVAGQTCSAASECLSVFTCADVSGTNKCTCDTSSGYAAPSDGATTCACDTGYSSESGACKKVAGQTCTAASECVSVFTCADVGGTDKCTCDTSSGYAAPTDGDTTCACDTGYSAESGACKKVAGQTCTAASECVSVFTCADVGGTDKCTCDTSSGYAAPTDGDTTCACDTGYSAESGACKKVAGQTCTAASECVSVFTCADVGGTDKCTCDTSSGYAAPTDGDTTCACDTGYSAESGACKKVAGQTCTAASECVSVFTCADVGGTDKCTCDTSSGYAAPTDGDTTCACGTGYSAESGACKKVAGQTCSAGSECLSVFTCADVSGTNKCTCDTSTGYAAPTDGDTTCACGTGYSSESGACKKVAGQTCSAASECLSVFTCADVSGTVKCTCDTSTGYAAPTDGDTTCACGTGYSSESGACKKVAGQTCSAASECLSVFTCADVSGTVKCTCDTSTGYAAPSDGATTCACDSDHTAQDSACVLKVGKACSSTTKDCVFGAMCDKATSTCLCDTSLRYQAGTTGDISCSCAATAVAMTIDGKTYCE
ncbi:uncharacterized protein LOC143301030 [Babylonia areolata]|uniref:uncharacterized protein LOC143301030 n=1 Tax=Babylonia areolata TaxID=304850 RepID=UPI003FD095F5